MLNRYCHNGLHPKLASSAMLQLRKTSITVQIANVFLSDFRKEAF